jgi:iron(III) transport system substrate-binding protein
LAASSLLVLLISLGLIHGAGAAPGRTGAAGSVILYTSVVPDVVATLARGFMEKNPQVRLEFLRAGSAEIDRRVQAEMEAGGIKADLLWLLDPPALMALRDRGQLQAYRSAQVRYLSPAWRDPSGFLTTTNLVNYVFVVNPALIPVSAGPKRWADLPRFGRTTAIPNPAFSGSMQVVVAALVREHGWPWFERARREGMTVLRSTSDVTRGLASREFGVGVAIDYSVYGQIRDGAPLVMIWPDDGVVSVQSMITITKNAQNAAAARLFVDYVLSQPGQQTLASSGIYSLRSDVAAPPAVPKPTEMKTLSAPYDWMAQNARELRTRFDEIMLR